MRRSILHQSHEELSIKKRKLSNSIRQFANKNDNFEVSGPM